MEEEEWRRIDGADGVRAIYEVSNFGRVRSVKILTQFNIENSGKNKPKRRKKRCYVRIQWAGKQMIKSVPRLVARAFCQNQDNKPDVNHIDGIPSNNRPDNLEWVTPEENIKHAKETKLFLYGAQVHCNKIDPNIAVEMRMAGASFKEIGMRFGATLQAAHAMLERLDMAWPQNAIQPSRSRPKNNRYSVEEAQKLRASGWSYEKISNHFGVSKDAVRSRLARHNRK